MEQVKIAIAQEQASGKFNCTRLYDILASLADAVSVLVDLPIAPTPVEAPVVPTVVPVVEAPAPVVPTVVPVVDVPVVEAPAPVKSPAAVKGAGLARFAKK